MGLSYLVYPGAHHTRFHHALGSLHLMQKVVRILKIKGVLISKKEENALFIAILLHDIGHGPFSHAIENSLIENVSHEFISLYFMQFLNKQFKGQLDLAIKIFKGVYERPFFHQLISGQLDMDRLDYLKRDSFYTGVSEGNINSERLISMMNVYDNQLVIEEKGIYSIEKILTSRRLMYWQVYLHKTGLVSERMIINILKRAKLLSKKGEILNISSSFKFFLASDINISNFSDSILDKFSDLDDYDLVTALKLWQNHPDFILSNLSKRLLNRNLLKIKFMDESEIMSEIKVIQKKWLSKYGGDFDVMSYFIFSGSVGNIGYDPTTDPILILHKKGNTSSLNESSNLLNIEGLSKVVNRYYVCYPKDLLS